MRILALDPSVNNVGWATLDLEFDSENNRVVKEDWNWGTWELNGQNFLMRCGDCRDYILQEIGDFDFLVVEWPMYYDSDKGSVAARQGYTINLAGVAMYICGYFQLHHTKMRLYTAPDWKGTTPKKVTARRFFRLFDVNINDIDEHAIDAVMMLLYHCRKEGLLPAPAPSEGGA
jgi:hypothetical protein